MSRTKIADKRELERLERSLKAVSNSNRMQILRILAKQGPTSVKDLATAVNMSQPACSVHIRVLYDAGFLQKERRGNQVFYSLDKEAVEKWHKSLIESLFE